MCQKDGRSGAISFNTTLGGRARYKTRGRIASPLHLLEHWIWAKGVLNNCGYLE